MTFFTFRLLRPDFAFESGCFFVSDAAGETCHTVAPIVCSEMFRVEIFLMGSSETAQETPAIFLKEIRGNLMDIRALKLSGDCRGEQHLRQAALLDLKRLPLDLLCS